MVKLPVLLSPVVCREDVREAREFLDSVGLQNCRVLAKIETRQSLLNFRGILTYADGIIVSRCAGCWGAQGAGVQRLGGVGAERGAMWDPPALYKVAVREVVLSWHKHTDTVSNPYPAPPASPGLNPDLGSAVMCCVR
jgi:hypothetical protein